MIYLKELGFNDDIIKTLSDNLPESLINTLTAERNNVSKNIMFLKELGISNYVDAFVKFHNMFLLDPESFSEIFSKYDKDDLIAKLEKNIAIMEYL